MNKYDYMNFLQAELDVNRRIAKNNAVCYYADWVMGDNSKAHKVLEICAEYAFSLDEIAKWGRWMREQVI